MPACTVYLLSLKCHISQFLTSLSKASIEPLVVSKVIRWIILPTTISTPALLAQNIHWDILLIVPSTGRLPQTLLSLIEHQWSVQAGVPSRLLADFAARNRKLLHPENRDVPKLTGSLDKPKINENSAQALELSPDLRTWVEQFGNQEGRGAVSMLNLLAFKEGMKEEYLKYGAEFAKSVGSRRGGNAKIVGTVIHAQDGTTDGGDGWDEIALAHYPSIWHFADMLASQDYQEVNHKYRVGSLKDTFILCTSELAIENLPKEGGAKL